MDVVVEEKGKSSTWSIPKSSSQPQCFEIVEVKDSSKLDLTPSVQLCMQYCIRTRWCMRGIPKSAQLRLLHIRKVVHGSWELRFTQTRTMPYLHGQLISFDGGLPPNMQELPMKHSIVVVHNGKAKHILQDMESLRYILDIIYTSCRH